MSKLFVVRGERPEGFVMVPNEAVRPNGTMSMQAVGLLAHLLSHDSGNWTVTTESLTAAFSNGIQGTRAAIRELEEHGYLVRVRRNTPGGFVHTWTVYETPDLRFTDNRDEESPSDYKSPSYGNPSDGHPSDGNRDDIKKTKPSEDQLEEDLKFFGSSATRPTTRHLAELALILGETDPLLVAATWLAMKADGARNPLSWARSFAERGELDGYLATHIYAEDYRAEAAELVLAAAGVAFDPWAVP